MQDKYFANILESFTNFTENFNKFLRISKFVKLKYVNNPKWVLCKFTKQQITT